MQGKVIFSPSALVRLAGWVTMVVAAGEVAGVEEASVSRPRVRRGKSAILKSSNHF